MPVEAGSSSSLLGSKDLKLNLAFCEVNVIFKTKQSCN